MVKIKVDLWKTGLHLAEIGIKKKEELMSKSRRFTKDMDIIGKVEIDKKDYGYIAYRKELWERKNPLERRVAIRLFSTDIEYLGAIDENLGRSISLTIVNEDPSPAYVVMLPGSKIVYTIERLRPRFAETDSYLLTYINDDGELKPILIRSKRLAFGSDWKVTDLYSAKDIAKVDGKTLDIGGEWEIKTNVKDERFWRTLILFAGSLKFYDDNKAKIEEIMKQIKKKSIKLSKSDLLLFYNPRVRR